MEHFRYDRTDAVILGGAASVIDDLCAEVLEDETDPPLSEWTFDPIRRPQYDALADDLLAQAEAGGEQTTITYALTARDRLLLHSIATTVARLGGEQTPVDVIARYGYDPLERELSWLREVAEQVPTPELNAVADADVEGGDLATRGLTMGYAFETLPSTRSANGEHRDDATEWLELAETRLTSGTPADLYEAALAGVRAADVARGVRPPYRSSIVDDGYEAVQTALDRLADAAALGALDERRIGALLEQLIDGSWTDRRRRDLHQRLGHLIAWGRFRHSHGYHEQLV